MANKHQISDPEFKRKLAEEAVKTLTNWFENLISPEVESEKEEYFTTIKMMMNFIIGAIHMDESLLTKGLDEFSPMISGLSKMWNFVKQANTSLFEKKLSLKQLDKKVLVKYFETFGYFMEMTESISSKIASVKDKIKEATQRSKTPVLTVTTV